MGSHAGEAAAAAGLSRAATRNAPAGPSPFRVEAPALPHEKFADPRWTAQGEPRASVPLTRLETLWLNTGTLCNLACATCYIESSPTNDALVYLSHAAALPFLDEAQALGTREIGFTGGEPFMNPDFLPLLEDALARGFAALVLSNAMKPMRRHEAALLALRAQYGAKLVLRISLDHHTQAVHEGERGPRSWGPAMQGLRWLSDNGFALAVAGRLVPDEDEREARAHYAALFAREGIAVDARDPARLVLFPEMDEAADIAEITTGCWSILGKSPADVMCATSRMVVHRKGEATPRIAACTLIPYHRGFDMGKTLVEASGEVALNHPHCARFCVLGGASCSA
jgi:pyruvate-formate lyase-activating enzyme